MQKIVLIKKKIIQLNKIAITSLCIKLPRPGDREKNLCGFRVKLPPIRPLITHDWDFTRFIFIAERPAKKTVNAGAKLYNVWFNQTENKAHVHQFSSRCSIHSNTA